MNSIVAGSSRTFEHRSPGITAIYNELKNNPRNRVLDLGSSSGASFNFFAQLSCNIHFESLDDFLGSEQAGQLRHGALRQALNDYLTEFDENQKFDVVLLWDTINYLDMPTLQWLLSTLNRYCHADTLVHAICYAGNRLPSRPNLFQVQNEYQVKVTQHAALTPRSTARHSSTQLVKHVPDYRLENSYLNYSGMEPGFAEYLYRFAPTCRDRIRRQVSDALTLEHSPYRSQRPAAVAEAGRANHNSHALMTVEDLLQRTPGARMLDLGLTNKTNSEYWIAQSGSYFSENLFHELYRAQGLDAGLAFKPHHLNFSATTKFDVILLWDLLNFLSPAQVQQLFQKLSPYCHSETVLHILVYAARERPSAPQHITVSGRGHLVLNPSVHKVPSQGLTCAGLLKAAGCYQLKESFIYRTGMQRGVYEYLLAPNSNTICRESQAKQSLVKSE